MDVEYGSLQLRDVDDEAKQSEELRQVSCRFGGQRVIKITSHQLVVEDGGSALLSGRLTWYHSGQLDPYHF